MKIKKSDLEKLSYEDLELLEAMTKKAKHQKLVDAGVVSPMEIMQKPECKKAWDCVKETLIAAGLSDIDALTVRSLHTVMRDYEKAVVTLCSLMSGNYDVRTNKLTGNSAFIRTLDLPIVCDVTRFEKCMRDISEVVCRNITK